MTLFDYLKYLYPKIDSNYLFLDLLRLLKIAIKKFTCEWYAATAITTEIRDKNRENLQIKINVDDSCW